jgi:hypothetical protein
MKTWVPEPEMRAAARRRSGQTGGSGRRSVRVLVLAGLGIALCVAAAAQTPKASDFVRLDPKQCVPISAGQRRWLSPEWDRFASFVSVCAARRGSARPPLFVVTLRVLDFDAALPQNAPAPHYPQPLLMLEDGTRVGSLPFLFPDDPPRTLHVSFGKWRNGFPEEIRLYVEDPTVTGSRYLPPLQWNATQKQYAGPRAAQ